MYLLIRGRAAMNKIHKSHPNCQRRMAFATAGFATVGLTGLRRGLRPLSGAPLSGAAISAPVHPAYRLVKEENVEEYGTQCYVYEHEATKAQVM